MAGNGKQEKRTKAKSNGFICDALRISIPFQQWMPRNVSWNNHVIAMRPELHPVYRRFIGKMYRAATKPLAIKTAGSPVKYRRIP